MGSRKERKKLTLISRKDLDRVKGCRRGESSTLSKLSGRIDFSANPAGACNNGHFVWRPFRLTLALGRLWSSVGNVVRVSFRCDKIHAPHRCTVKRLLHAGDLCHSMQADRANILSQCRTMSSPDAWKRCLLGLCSSSCCRSLTSLQRRVLGCIQLVQAS